MKFIAKIVLLPALILSLLLIYGCPVGMNFPPDEPGTVPVDKELVGTWTCTLDTCSDLKVIRVEKKDNFSYTVTVTEKGEGYMADEMDFTGYITQIDGKKFFYALGATSGSYFLYHYVVSGKSLSLFDVGLLEGGKDAVTSTEAFRAEISASLKKEGCLSERVDFKKN
jgi:hypothetical protein